MNIDYRNTDPNTEGYRQREYLEALILLEKVFNLLREPLEVNDKPSITRDENRLFWKIVEVREELHGIITRRERKGIFAAEKEKAAA